MSEATTPLEDGFREYKLRQLKGITDLRDYYPGQAAEWWTDEQWAEWERKKPERQEADRKYIAEAKADGSYGTEYFITIKLKYNPLFDSPTLFDKKPGLDSFRIVFLNPEE